MLSSLKNMTKAFMKLPCFDSVYFAIAKNVYPVFTPIRRWPKFQIKKLEDALYVIQRDDSSPFYFYERTRFDRYIFCDGHDFMCNFIFKKYSLPEDNIKVEEGDVVLEVGANVGEFSIAASQLSSKMICIEPDIKPYRCLELNLADINHARTINVLCGNDNSEVKFYISSSDADSSIIEPDEYESVEIKTMVTLDSILQDENLSVVDFLKIEAEGAEPEVLGGGSGMLSVTRKIAVDCGPERFGESTHEEVGYILRSHGFEVFEVGYMIFGKKSGG